MKIGMPTLIEYKDLIDDIKLYKEGGFDFFELNMTYPFMQDEGISERLLDIKKEYNAEYTIHLHDQINPFDFYALIRESGVQSVVDAIALAKKIGAKRLTMHMAYGMYASLSSGKKFIYNVYEKEYIDNVKAFLDKCDKLLEGTGILLCLENTNGFIAAQKKAIDIMLQNDNVGLTFDIGHCYKANDVDKSFLLERKDKIRHFHIHDVNSTANHIALGDGVLNLTEYFDLAKQCNCNAVIEVKESQALKTSLNYISTHNLLK